MIDSHCHLADDVFEADAAAVVGRARQAGVTRVLCILDAASPVERARAPSLLAQWPEMVFSAGIHPHGAGAWAGRVDEAVAAVHAVREGTGAVRAIGEIGLDYHYDLSPRDVQREVFGAQLDAAGSLDLPVVIHTREAEDDTVAMLRTEGRARVRGVMHCFTGTRDLARQALDLGFFVSLAGIVTFPRADALREIARYLPSDRLLVETDSPFLAPVPFRGKRNEPAWVVRVAERLAELRGVSFGALAECVTENFAALLGSGPEATARKAL